jgi:WD40 repeat protein
MLISRKNTESGLKLISGSEDATIRIWDLDSGDCLSVLEQDAGISCLEMAQRPGYQDRLVFFGDQVRIFAFAFFWRSGTHFQTHFSIF